MLFNSLEFIIIFLPIALLVYYSLIKYRLTYLATASLVLASLVFYSYWDIRYLPLLLGSIVFNYTMGSLLEKNRSKSVLIAGIAVNLLLLIYFKYTGFFMKTLNDVFGASLSIPAIILPLGISFFTFTQTAYLVDAYRGETQGYSFLTYILFVTIFPHLIAGPILYHKDMISQFSKVRNFVFSYKNVSLGLVIFVFGLFKKVGIADALAPWVAMVFDHPNQATFIDAWIGAIGYTLQLYFDFSGYSEMAVGLGLMFNFKLPVNFNSPYRATSIIDFWRRWHMTLSAFLRNYLYIPLGGNRKGEFTRLRNLMLTMLLGGLWHGAGWTFIAWGGLHGLYLVINHSWQKVRFQLPKSIAWLLTFLCVVIAWVFFRANSITDSISILQAMIGLKGIILPEKVTFSLFKIGDLQFRIGSETRFLLLIAVFFMFIKFKNPHEALERFRPTAKWAVTIAVFLLICIVHLNNPGEFLYFQF